MERRIEPIAAMLAACIVALPATANAQQWRLGVDAGRLRSALDPVARASGTLVAGAGYEDAMTAFRLSAALPTPGDSVRWLAAGAWKRLASTHGALTAGVDVTGSAFAYRARSSSAGDPGGGILDPFRQAIPGSTVTTTGHALAAELLPVVAWEHGIAQLQARAGASWYDASASDVTRGRVAGVGDLQLLIRPTPTLALVPMLRHVAPRGEDAATYAGASAIAVAGKLTLRADAGRWVAGLAQDTTGRAAWSFGTELRVAPFASVNATARRDAADPLRLTAAQTSWGIGASILLGRPHRPATPVVERDTRGAAAIRLAASRAGAEPRIAGDFNGWKPAPMQRTGGEWRYAVAAGPGVYNYAFVDADGNWFVPEGTPGRKDDGMGGHVAVLVVR